MKNIIPTTLRYCMTLSAVGFFAANSQADLLLQDSFDYATGPLAGNGSWVNSASLITVSENNLSRAGFSDVLPDGNVARVNGQAASATQNSYVTFAPQSSGTVYASLLLNFTYAGGNYTFMGLLPSDHAGTFNNTFDPCDMSSIAASGGYKLGIRTLGKSATYDTMPVLALNTPQLVVMKYDFGAKSASLFLNPDLSGGEPTPAFVSTGTLAASDVGRFYIRIGGVNQGNYLVDDVRIGPTWSDVAVVPEPGTWSLMAAGLLGLALCRGSRH